MAVEMTVPSVAPNPLHVAGTFACPVQLGSTELAWRGTNPHLGFTYANQAYYSVILGAWYLPIMLPVPVQRLGFVGEIPSDAVPQFLTIADHELEHQRLADLSPAKFLARILAVNGYGEILNYSLGDKDALERVHDFNRRLADLFSCISIVEELYATFPLFIKQDSYLNQTYPQSYVRHLEHMFVRRHTDTYNQEYYRAYTIISRLAPRTGLVPLYRLFDYATEVAALSDFSHTDAASIHSNTGLFFVGDNHRFSITRLLSGLNVLLECKYSKETMARMSLTDWNEFFSGNISDYHADIDQRRNLTVQWLLDSYDSLWRGWPSFAPNPVLGMSTLMNQMPETPVWKFSLKDEDKAQPGSEAAMLAEKKANAEKHGRSLVAVLAPKRGFSLRYLPDDVPSNAEFLPKMAIMRRGSSWTIDGKEVNGDTRKKLEEWEQKGEDSIMALNFYEGLRVQLAMGARLRCAGKATISREVCCGNGNVMTVFALLAEGDWTKVVDLDGCYCRLTDR